MELLRTRPVADPPAVAGARRAGPPPRWLSVAVGTAAIVSSLVYLASDVLETVQRGFSTERLTLTYLAEATIPLFVLGLWAAQRPRIGRLGLVGAATYAYVYVFFTSTVVYALVVPVRDYAAVTAAFGAWMVVHGVVMVVGGVAFGVAVVRAGVLPRWTGLCLAIGVVLVAAASGLPNFGRLLAEAVVVTAFTGMGWALLRPATAAPRPVPALSP